MQRKKTREVEGGSLIYFVRSKTPETCANARRNRSTVSRQPVVRHHA
jgi:hypothetical protein